MDTRVPTPLDLEELEAIQAKAVWLGGNGHTVHAWLLRLWITPIGDLLTGKVWPNAH